MASSFCPLSPQACGLLGRPRVASRKRILGLSASSSREMNYANPASSARGPARRHGAVRWRATWYWQRGDWERNRAHRYAIEYQGRRHRQLIRRSRDKATWRRKLRFKSPGSDRWVRTSPTGPKHQMVAGAVDPPQALWKTRVLTSMLSRGSTLAGAVGSSKAECAVKRAVPSSAES